MRGWVSRKGEIGWYFHYVEDKFSSWNKTPERRYKKESKQQRAFSTSTNHEAFALSLGILKISGILRFSWYLKNNLMFSFKIISVHPCFCFLWVMSVLWKLRNSDFFFFFVLPCLLAETHNGPPFLFSVEKNGNPEPEKFWVDWHFLLLRLKLRWSRERKIFSLPSPSKGLSFWSWRARGYWSPPESSSVWKWNHFSELLSLPRPSL